MCVLQISLGLYDNHVVRIKSDPLVKDVECLLNGIKYQVKPNNLVYSEQYSLEDNLVD